MSSQCSVHGVSSAQFAPTNNHFARRLILSLVAVIAAGIVASGCTIRLAPDFNQAIVDGLSKANEDAMTLFASASSGAGIKPFSQREASYNGVIGKIDALRVEVQSRPNPPPFQSQLLWTQAKGNAGTNNADIVAAPTPEILSGISTSLTKMRDTDKAGKLTKKLIPGFKRPFEIRMGEALTYEKALQR